jgi:hypothetical protein
VNRITPHAAPGLDFTGRWGYASSGKGFPWRPGPQANKSPPGGRDDSNFTKQDQRFAGEH